jgi:hypothetical protein
MEEEWQPLVLVNDPFLDALKMVDTSLDATETAPAPADPPAQLVRVQVDRVGARAGRCTCVHGFRKSAQGWRVFRALKSALGCRGKVTGETGATLAPNRPVSWTVPFTLVLDGDYSKNPAFLSTLEAHGYIVQL